MADEAGSGVPASDPSTIEPTDTNTGQARTFSQEDVDRIVQERLARAKNAPPPDYDELKKKAALLDEIEEQSKTELEREREARLRAEETASKVQEAANRRLVEAALIAEAAKQNAVRPEHLPRLIDVDSVTVGDDGQVAGAGDAVQAFLKANPEYVGSRANGSADQGVRSGSGIQLTREQLQKMTPAEISRAHDEGKLDHLLGAA